MIDEQASLGSKGKIVIKINSITDIDIIEKLKQASCAGVQIYMIVRGICCILPEVPQKTRWQGIIMEMGLCPTAPPTACAEKRVFPNSAAIFCAKAP